MDIGSLYNIADSDSGQVVADGLKANFEALVNEVNGKQDKGNYVTEESIGSKGYITDTELNEKGFIDNNTLEAKNYATKSEIPDISGLATKEELGQINGVLDNINGEVI